MVHSYSRTGSYNTSRGFSNQDAVYDESYRGYSIITLADGVSDCRFSAEGAALACRAAADMLINEAERLMQLPGEKLAYLVIEQVLYVIEKLCGTDDAAQYASTLAFALVEEKSGDALLFNLGDGAVLRTAYDCIDTEIEPRTFRGLPAQTTSRGAYRAAEVRRIRLHRGEELIIGSDGFVAALEETGRIADAIENGDHQTADMILEMLDISDDTSYIAYRHE